MIRTVEFISFHETGAIMSLSRIFIISLFLFSSIAMTACTAPGVIAGSGAAVGIAAAKEGGIRNSIRDQAIELEISDLWFKKDLDMFSRLNITVYDGRVMLTGVVKNADDRVEAVRLAWKAEHVTQVINEIQIREEGRGWSAFAKDGWIKAQLRSKITFDKKIQSINYSIEVVEGVVYLIGVGQDQAEVDLVIDHARNIAHVTQVVSYVRLRGDIPPNLQTNTDTE